MYAVELRRRRGSAEAARRRRRSLPRLATIGALLAAAEAVGAAGRCSTTPARYAAERRQFGRTIGSFQALRHLLADMYVRQASSWSTVLYAAAALDEDADDAARTASIAKAYVSRAAREVAHGAMQVFGGIAFTAEHPAHRYLRRIVVREQQFGDAAHHERALGRALAAAAVPRAVADGADDRTGFNDPTAQRLERDHHRRRARRSSARCWPRRCTTRAGALRRRADLRRQVEPDLPRRLATPARSCCAARRSGTSCPPRTTWCASTASWRALERHSGARPRMLAPRRRRRACSARRST